jgi:hypothetical protein
VIQGVINGDITNEGNAQSSVIATFQSVAPFNVSSVLQANPGLPSTLTLQIIPALANPFPIDQLSLPNSISLTVGVSTPIYATIVPEPSTALLFLALAIMAGARSRHRLGGRAASARGR